MKPIGQQIRMQMVRKDISITELAKLINVNRSTIHRYLNNEYRPSERKIFQLERVLEFTIER